MKNVLFILVLLTGFAVSGLQAQNCKPCPPCPACPLGCCMSAVNKSASASAQIVPATLDLSAACTPEMKAACLASESASTTNSPACQPSGASTSQPACQGNVSSTAVKSCQPACNAAAKSGCQPAGKTTNATEKAIDQQYHHVAKPMKS